jgi:hypothetical protein
MDENYIMQQVELLVCSQYCTSWIELIMIIHDFSSAASLTTWSLRTCSYSTVSCCSTTPAILGSREATLAEPLWHCHVIIIMMARVSHQHPVHLIRTHGIS